MTMMQYRQFPARPLDAPPYIIHVDSERLKECREKKTNDIPVIRMIVNHNEQTPWGQVVGTEIYYGDIFECDGPVWMVTRWNRPLEDRPNAICVLQTRSAIRLGAQI